MVNQTHMRAMALAMLACIVVLLLLLSFEIGYHSGWQDAVSTVAGLGG